MIFEHRHGSKKVIVAIIVKRMIQSQGATDTKALTYDVLRKWRGQCG